MTRVYAALAVLATFTAVSQASILMPDDGPIEALVGGGTPNSPRQPDLELILTIAGIGADSISKDGFIESSAVVADADPLGYVVLDSRSLWLNQRVILGQAFRMQIQTEIGSRSGPAGSGDIGEPPHSPPPVPEPCTLALLGLGGATWLWRSFRRSRQPSDG